MDSLRHVYHINVTRPNKFESSGWRASEAAMAEDEASVLETGDTATLRRLNIDSKLKSLVGLHIASECICSPCLSFLLLLVLLFLLTM